MSEEDRADSILGFTGSMIMMLLPKPISAKQQVRHSLAHNIGEIGELYGKILSNFELEAQDIDDGCPDVVDRATARMDKVRERFLAVTVGLSDIPASQLT